MTDALIIFARYPQVGRCKTRLIGELGEQAATDLHRAMTAHTLDWARRWSRLEAVTPIVHFHGGDAEQMAALFGHDLAYTRQAEGDLGSKMAAAVRSSLDSGAQRVLIVGTDCPELNERVAATALARLESHDVCLVPARDGGYTLVALSARAVEEHVELLAALFDDIPWGTGEVMRSTAQRLSDTKATVSLLPAMRDVDLPSDIEHGRAALAGDALPKPCLSIIIPTYGHEPQLPEAIASAVDPQVEVIVVAAERTTEALAAAATAQVQLICTPAGRGGQLNAGARLASGGVLLFLHADTSLPASYFALIQRALHDPSIVGGAFALEIASSRRAMRWIERGVRLRTRLFDLPYGDQAIFVRTSEFEALAGFRGLPIMEDYEFVRRLKRRGKLALLAASVRTSPRRWEQLGPWRTTCINQLMLLGYHAGIPIDRLAKFYRRQKGKAAGGGGGSSASRGRRAAPSRPSWNAC